MKNKKKTTLSGIFSHWKLHLRKETTSAQLQKRFFVKMESGDEVMERSLTGVPRVPAAPVGPAGPDSPWEENRGASAGAVENSTFNSKTPQKRAIRILNKVIVNQLLVLLLYYGWNRIGRNKPWALVTHYDLLC